MKTSEEISKAENFKIALEEFFTNFLFRLSLILDLETKKFQKWSKMGILIFFFLLNWNSCAYLQ